MTRVVTAIPDEPQDTYAQLTNASKFKLLAAHDKTQQRILTTCNGLDKWNLFVPRDLYAGPVTYTCHRGFCPQHTFETLNLFTYEDF